MNSNLESKIALDRNGKKIGKITREDIVLSENSCNDEFFAVISVQRIFQEEVHFSLSLETYQILNIDENTVTFDITKKEFNILLQQQKTSKRLQAKAAKFGEAKKNDQAMAVSFRMKF